MNLSRYATLPRLLAIGVLSAAIPFGAQALVVTGTSSAYGESVFALVGVNPVLSGPTPTASGTAPAPYNNSNQLPSVNVANGALTTGLMTVNAQSNVDGGAGSRFALASATVNDLFLLVDVSSFTAGAVMSTANVSGDFGSLTAFGTTTLTNASLNGGPATSSTPAPNTVLFNANGLLIVANEQTLNCNTFALCALQVNGLHFTFTNFFTGSGPVNGDVIFAHSEALLAAAAVAAVPEPATWSMFGIGVAGLLAAVRRRRPADAAA